MNDSNFADWLYSACGNGEPVTVDDLMIELAQLRRGPKPELYDDLPKAEAECDAALKRLAAAGRAVQVVWEGQPAWRWAAAPEKVEAQGELF